MIAGNAAHVQRALSFIHCDVFASEPFTGNSLAVFPDSGDLTAQQMLTLTQELRHFETIFLKHDGDHISARIFDLHEELPFAGHPLIGAACTLKALSGDHKSDVLKLELAGGRVVSIETEQKDNIPFARLDQGHPSFLGEVSDADRKTFIECFNLQTDDLMDLPMEVVSTGLRYLVIPVRRGLELARIVVSDLDQRLNAVGAEFAYLLNIEDMEGRHWNNDGVVEDVATGSAAGVAAAYLRKYERIGDGEANTLRQGRFVGRPSEIEIAAFGASPDISRITVAGSVAFVGEGTIRIP